MRVNVTGTLPEDVLVQILLRLPVRSLLRFSCICKVWCNLIKCPFLIASHLHHPIAEDDYYVLIMRCLQDRATNVLSYHSSTELNIVLPDLRIPYFDGQSVQILGPCNGIVCITNYIYSTIVLCNPAIREFKLVPERPFGCPQDMRFHYLRMGFGFDSSTNDYKIVRLVHFEDDTEYYDEIDYEIVKAEVYQYNTDSWKEIDAVLPELIHAPCLEIFFHGATHFLVESGHIGKILSFCITTEVFREFDVPQDCSTYYSKALTVLNGFLVLLAYTGEFVDIWMMRQYGVSASWRKQLTIGPLSGIKHPLTPWRNSAILLQKTNGQILSCAIDKEEIKELDIFGYPTTLRALVYKESLVSIRK